MQFNTTVVLKSPKRLSLEQCLDYINTDELVEITPNSIRMRKKILNTAERKKKKEKTFSMVYSKNFSKRNFFSFLIPSKKKLKKN